MSSIAAMDLEEAAKAAAGNWMRFQSFVWWRAKDIEDAANHAIIYTQHRDSGLLDQSNADAIAKALEPFTEDDDPDVTFESHSHWAVGHIDGFSVRVFRDGEITEAFRTYHELAERMDNYPILDESDYSKREFDATFDNIDHAAWRIKREYASLPADWQSSVHEYLSENCAHALESTDDQGGWPSEEDLEAAFDALGYARVE